MFYSRKNYLRPDLQLSIHQSFDQEVAHLDELFESELCGMCGGRGGGEGGSVRRPNIMNIIIYIYMYSY